MTSDAALALSRGQRGRSLAAVIAGVFGVGVSFGAIVPLMTLILESRGIDAATIGLNSAMFPLAILLLTPFLPRVAARLGTMRSMLAGLALTVVTMLLLPVLDSLAAWFVLRFLIGAGIALHWLVSETWINLVVSERMRGRVMGLYASVLGGGFALGPVLLQATGIEGWIPFAAAAAAVASSAAPLALGLGLAPPLVAHSGRAIGRIILAQPVAMAAALSGGLTDAGLFVLLPLYGLKLGLDRNSAVLLLTAFTAGNLALQVPIGWVADHMDRRRLLVVFALVGIAGAALLPAAVAVSWLLWLLLFLWGGILLGLYTVGLSLIGQHTPGDHLAAANAAFIVVYELGSMSGPVLGGAAMDLWPPHGLLIVVVAGLALLLAVATAAGRRR